MKALLAAGANKDAKNNVSTPSVHHMALLMILVSHDLRLDILPSSWLPIRVMGMCQAVDPGRG